MNNITCTILFIFLVLVPCSTKAQFYVHSGYSYSNINSDIIYSDGMGGLLFGLGGRIMIGEGKELFIQPEASFTRKGFEYSNFPDNALIKFYYFTAPVTLHYKLTPFFSVEGGLEIAGLLDARFESSRFIDRINVSDTYNSWDLGALVGIGIYENESVNIFIRYIHGLRKLLHYPDFDNFGYIAGEIKDVRNRALQIGVRVILVK